MKTANRFVRGQSVYTCRCCKRKTRQTGRGDNDGVQLCAECYDLAGEENHLSDKGKFYGKPAEILALIAAVEKLGGDASCWNGLKATAEMPANPTPALTEIKFTLNNGAGGVTTSYPLRMQERALVQVAQYLADRKSFTVTYE